jgi:hypothetical protein
MSGSLSRACVLAALLGTASALTSSCSTESVERASHVGSLQMDLEGTASSGVRYRLRAATFDISGTSQATVSSETNPSATSISLELKAGTYLIDLEPGWYLEREQDGGFAQVRAFLLSDNPAPFTIADQQTTTVQYRFSAGDDAVAIGDGRLVIGIDVNDGDGAPPDGGYDPRLVYYCTFDAPSAITSPAIGPGGTIAGGSFAAGRRGNAFVSSSTEEALLPNTTPADRGTVEFWAKLSGYPDNEVIPWGGSPSFLSNSDGNEVWMGLNGNNGGSAGGLVESRITATSATNCFSTSVTYGQILGDAAAWHHYALAWDSNGVPGSAYHIQMFLDGRPIGSPTYCGNNNDSTNFPAATGAWWFPVNQNVRVGRSVSIDELKMWNYAKTDFTDSLR